VRISTSSGDVKNPDALLKPGGARSVLRRPQPAAAPTWPAGTTAEASSAHAGNNGNDGQPRTYDAGNAIDGNPDTFWNDDTLGVFPDVLTITAPQVTPLQGITVISNSDGVPTDYTVDVWTDGDWHTAATVTGNDAVQKAVPFAEQVSTDRVRITVTHAQDTSHGNFTRINEVWPAPVEPIPIPSVTVDFGKVVVGYPQIRFTSASANSPGVRVAFSETRQFLTDRSDFTRADQAGGAGGARTSSPSPRRAPTGPTTKASRPVTRCSRTGCTDSATSRSASTRSPRTAPPRSPGARSKSTPWHCSSPRTSAHRAPTAAGSCAPTTS
jgi:hypothetical protein